MTEYKGRLSTGGGGGGASSDARLKRGELAGASWGKCGGERLWLFGVVFSTNNTQEKPLL